MQGGTVKIVNMWNSFIFNKVGDHWEDADVSVMI